MSRFSCICMGMCRCMCRCWCLTLMALVSGLMAELLLVSSSSAQSTSSNSRTGVTAPSMPRTSCCPASTFSSRETVRWTELWARLGVHRVALQ